MPRADRWLNAASLASALAVSGCLAGCESGGARLTVRVQTGFRAGLDFTVVRSEVFVGTTSCDTTASALHDAREPAQVVDQPALVSGSFRGLETPPLSRGIYTIRARLEAPDGATLASRCVVTSLTDDRVVRVALTVDCLGVTCPDPRGDPDFDQCLNGRCVADDCDLDDPSTRERCCDRAALGDACDLDPTLCQVADDCERALDCSGPLRCEDGACVEPEDDLCDDGEYCDARSGLCDAVREPMDAGVGDAAMAADTALAELDAAAPADARGELDAAGPDAPDGGSDAGSDVGGALTDGARPRRDAGSDARVDSGRIDSGDVCECSPGEVDTDTVPCGMCGASTRSRGCGSTCSWDAWSSFGPCSGEGACAPGAVDTRMTACGPCGGMQSSSRSCDASCSWGDFGPPSACSLATCTDECTAETVCPFDFGNGQGSCGIGTYQVCQCQADGTWAACAGACRPPPGCA